MKNRWFFTYRQPTIDATFEVCCTAGKLFIHFLPQCGTEMLHSVRTSQAIKTFLELAFM